MSLTRRSERALFKLREVDNKGIICLWRSANEQFSSQSRRREVFSVHLSESGLMSRFGYPRYDQANICGSSMRDMMTTDFIDDEIIRTWTLPTIPKEGSSTIDFIGY